MILDGQLQFSDNQSVTVTAVSTNSVDLGPFTNNLNVAIGTGEVLYVFINNPAALVGAGATVTVTLETDDNSAFSSPTVVQTLGTFGALAVAGTVIVARLAAVVNFERFIQLRYTVAGGTLASSQFDAHIVKDIDAYKSYADNFTIS